MDRRGERKRDGSMRSDRYEGGERRKKQNLGPVPTTHCHLVLHQLGDFLRDAWRWCWIPLGGRLETPPLSGGQRRLLRTQAVGRSHPFYAPPHHGGRQQALTSGKRRRLLRSLTDSSRPSRTQQAGNKLIRPPGNSLQHTASSVHGEGLCSTMLDSTADSPQRRGLFDSTFLLLPGFWHQCNEMLCEEGARTASNCSVNNGDCDHECHEREDGLARTCSCIEGYQLQDNSRKCTPKNEASCGQIRIVKSFYKNKPLVGLQPWVVGGTVGKKGESPWQALILNNQGKFHCGGVLIDENWVLTAAHCLETSTRFSVRLGDYDRLRKENTEKTLPVKQPISHPEYNPYTVDNDIALLRLATPATFSTYILPACLPSQELAERMLHRNGTITVVTGWGKDNETANHFSSTLNFIEIPIMDKNECSRHMMNNLTQNMLCGGVLGQNKDACEGDSGGPMMTLFHDTWFLVGLVSWGEGCGQRDKLGIYTKVSGYLDWINSVRQGWDKV